MNRRRIFAGVSFPIALVLTALATSHLFGYQAASLSGTGSKRALSATVMGLSGPQLPSPSQQGEQETLVLFVADPEVGAVLRFDADSGQDLGALAMLDDAPRNLRFDASGNLYVLLSADGQDRIDRLNAATGEVLGTVLELDGDPQLGPLLFAPQGELLTASCSLNRIVRIGLPSGDPAPSIESEGFDCPTALALNSQGNLLVSTFSTAGIFPSGRILRFGLASGQFLGEFLEAGTGVNSERGMSFGNDGNLYIIESLGDRIIRFSGQDGQLLGTFAEQEEFELHSLAFSPDGTLYVGRTNDAGDSQIVRYQAESGTLVDVLVDVAPASGLRLPSGLAFTTEAISPQCDCDVNVDGGVNVADVQLIINQALGSAPPDCDINGDGAVNVADVQIVINAALGQQCAASPPP